MPRAPTRPTAFAIRRGVASISCHRLDRLATALLGVALVVIALVDLSTPAKADDQDAGVWLANEVVVPLGERLTLHGMVQNRWSDEIDQYERTVVRPWIAYAWPEGGHVAVGYDLHEFENPDRWEQRAWQRLGLSHSLEHLTLVGHVWLEERFFQNTNDVALRARFNAGASFDLGRDFSVLVRNEAMFDLNGTSRIRNAGLGENQFAITFSHRLPGNLRFDLGYLQQYIDRRGPDDLVNHFVMTGFSWRTPQLVDWL